MSTTAAMALATSSADPRPPAEIAEALELLDKRSLVLAIHDASFPSAEGEDSGRGTPYSRGGMRLARLARRLGFTGIQFGPQGQTSRINPSPYDGTLFSRSTLSIDLAALVDGASFGGLLSRASLDRIVLGNPRPDGRRVPYAYVFDAYCAALDEANQRFLAGLERGDAASRAIAAQLAEFRNLHGWLRHDALYEALCVDHRQVHWRTWPHVGEQAHDAVLCCPPEELREQCERRRAEILARYRQVVGRYELGQLIVHRQHREFRGEVASWGLKLYGDVQVGMSPRDTWSRQLLLLPDYLLGAPPSRTNPEGQPWSHGVLDPEQYGAGGGRPGPVLAFVSERLGKMLEEFDGLRIDHPHGLVCPWVYRAADPDPFRAVRAGARLFSSPSLPDHPDLARYAIARSEQLNPDPLSPRHADDWVRWLEPDQVDCYAILFDALVDSVRAHGREVDDLLCEVLSTQPYPLARVMERHGLGRFRVTQKARLDDPNDVYRSENARPRDWIMVGNHDTPPIWRLARNWQDTAVGEQWAWYLARRLRPEADVEAFARGLLASPERLVHAKFAHLFASPARHAMVFFADLLGMEEIYNAPGIVHPDNWTLRVAPDYARIYAENVLQGTALNLPCALALALRSRGAAFVRSHQDLIARLESMAGWQVTGGA